MDTGAALRLFLPLCRNEVLGRYRGSMFGVLWVLATPLFMLAIYTFVFGVVLRVRWPNGTASPPSSTAEFALILFAGLVVFQLFAEVVTRSPRLVLANPSYVKKVVFPLEVLVPVALGAGLFHLAVSFAVLMGAMLIVCGGIPLSALWLPFVLAPLAMVVLGLGWFLAALGVYFRDIEQVIGTLVTALLFLSPVFYPLSALPDWVRPWIALNPITLPVEEVRAVLILGRMPDLAGLAAYALAAIVVAGLGYLFFQKTRRGFADVL